MKNTFQTMLLAAVLAAGARFAEGAGSLPVGTGTDVQSSKFGNSTAIASSVFGARGVLNFSDVLGAGKVIARECTVLRELGCVEETIRGGFSLRCACAGVVRNQEKNCQERGCTLGVWPPFIDTSNEELERARYTSKRCHHTAVKFNT